jgi:hypothetical protein
VCITGQADSRKLHNEAFQTVGIVEIAKPVTKLAVQVKEAAQLPWIFREAFRIARSCRPGPALIDRSTCRSSRSSGMPALTSRCRLPSRPRRRRGSNVPLTCCSKWNGR